MGKKRKAGKQSQPANAGSAKNAPKETAVSAPGQSPSPGMRFVQGYHPDGIPKPKPNNRALYTVMFVALFAVFAFAAVQAILYLVQSHQAKLEERMIRTLIAQYEAEEAQAAVSPTDEPEATAISFAQAVSQHAMPAPTSAKPAALIQFTKALSINPETVGQLKMGESINTYVVQRDNVYYLRHSFSGEYSFSGAIFLDVTCSICPQSRNLIFHGHNMQDGTAFGKLSRFENIDYLNKYPFIEFSTLYESAIYRPFAVVYFSVDTKAENYLDIYQVNSMTDQEFIQFVSKVQQMSVYHIPVNVARTDKILTITTCATSDSDTRFAVFAVKCAT